VATPAADLQARLERIVADRYEVRRLLGRGGMGAVFLAVDRKLEREVAIKVLPPELAHDEQFVQRFEREARIAAKLDHSGIIPIYAVESDEGLHFFVMKYVQGRTLDGLLAAGALPIDLAQQILWESACALGHAHERGVVHRDVKPANIMLDESGRAMLTDFGISKALQSASHFTATGQVIGTPHYMSPEQARGEEVGGPSDQYSLGIVGYRMLAGRLPFEDDSVHTVIYKHVFEMPPPLQSLRKGVPESLASAIQRALAKDPSERFPAMEDFATAVWPENPVLPAARQGQRAVPVRRSVSSVDEVTEVSAPTQMPLPPPRKRRRLMGGLVAAVLLVTAGSTGAFLTPQGRALVSRISGGRGAEPAPATADSGAVRGDSLVNEALIDSPTVSPAEASPSVAMPEPQPPRPQPTRQDPPRSTQPAVPRVGYLTIDASPSGLLIVDGREIRDTPVFRFELAVGEHRIEIRREGYVTFQELMGITIGNETRKRVTLVPEGP
jgi:serine/threonine-protein kinase